MGCKDPQSVARFLDDWYKRYYRVIRRSEQKYLRDWYPEHYRVLGEKGRKKAEERLVDFYFSPSPQKIRALCALLSDPKVSNEFIIGYLGAGDYSKVEEMEAQLKKFRRSLRRQGGK